MTATHTPLGPILSIEGKEVFLACVSQYAISRETSANVNGKTGRRWRTPMLRFMLIVILQYRAIQPSMKVSVGWSRSQLRIAWRLQALDHSLMRTRTRAVAVKRCNGRGSYRA